RIGAPESADLFAVAGPPIVASPRSGAHIAMDGLRNDVCEEVAVPVPPSWKRHDLEWGDGPQVAICCDLGEKRAPRSTCLLRSEPLERHAEDQSIAARCADLLAPIGVEQRVAAEAEKLGEQAFEGLIALGFYGELHAAQRRGQIVRLERHSRDDPEGPPATTFERPQKLWIAACIDGPDLPVGRDDFRLDQACSGGPESLGEAAKSAALDQTGNPDGRASASLDIAPALDRYSTIDPSPHATGAEADSGHGR